MLMPVFKDTLKNKKAFLSNREIIELNEIVIENYQIIYDQVQMRLRITPIFCNSINYLSDENLSYPKKALAVMPDYMREYIVNKENQNALDKLTDEIMSDSVMMDYFMKDCDISQNGIVNYDEEQEIESAEKHEEEYSENDYFEMDDEEIAELSDEQKHALLRVSSPCVSYLISQSCKDISDSIEIIERRMKKTPFHGMMLKLVKG